MSNKPQPGPITKVAARKRAQRAVSVSGLQCAACGSTTSLARHHEDYSKPTDVRILCLSCHQRMHWRENWSDRLVKSAKCVVCGVEFQPKRSRSGKICGNSFCLERLGELSAEKRWRGGLTA